MAQAPAESLPEELEKILSIFPDELVNLRVEVGESESSGWGLFSMRKTKQTGPPAYMAGDHSLFEATPVDLKREIVLRSVEESPQLDRAVGSIVGMGVGDWVGHPMEFVDIARSQDPIERRPHFVLEEFKWYNEKNAFRLKRGQWTDDASMGLCMADSLLVKREYDGSDIRTRFWNWWNKGYNNAFRKEEDRQGSVGLGGNISKSLYDMTLDQVPTPRFVSEGEDSGNGSLMRLTPVPIFFSHNLEHAKNFARESSFTTHPGHIAAEACAFMSFLIIQAIQHTDPSANVQQFLDEFIAAYDNEMKEELDRLEADPYEDQATQSRIIAKRKIRQLIASSDPEDSTEYNWNWRIEPFNECCIKGYRNRGRKYNGYPVSPGYWGAYCMDGLAMALNSVYYSTSFANAVERCVNLLGDADSTGSICGQIAGAIYGFRNLNANEPDRLMIERLADWDDWEFALRGVLLFKLGAMWTPRANDEVVDDAVPVEPVAEDAVVEDAVSAEDDTATDVSVDDVAGAENQTA